MSINLIKLVVGIDNLDDFAALQERDRVKYHGQLANPIWTRHKPKRDKELIEGGSAYRVIKNRIVCRQKILGFEIVEDTPKGKMCMILVEPTIYTTIAKPKRPFQGWRYLEPDAAPRDTGTYQSPEDRPPPEMAKALAESGLL